MKQDKLFMAECVAVAVGAPTIGEMMEDISEKYRDDVTAPKETPPPPIMKREQLRRLKQMGTRK